MPSTPSKNFGKYGTCAGLGLLMIHSGDRMTVGGKKNLDAKKAEFQKDVDAINTVENIRSGKWRR